jgi:hypothetical protein
MSPALRFLGLAMVGWVGLRAAMLGALPGADLSRFDSAKPAATPPVVETELAPPEPLMASQPAYPPWMASAPAPAVIHYYYPAPQRPAVVYRETRWLEPPPPLVRPVAPAFYASAPLLDPSPLSRLAAASSSPLGHPPPAPQSFPAPTAAVNANKFDRVHLTTWAMLRAEGFSAPTSSLASGSALGGSQAGARLALQLTREIAASLRSTSTIGQSGGEVAFGARVQPVRGFPVWATLERRQRIGEHGGGRNAFALFFEGGLWERPLPKDFRLDAYLQGGVVGFNSRDGFIDGAVTATRPVFRTFSAGLGLWGGAQPGVHRLDAGPRVTMKVRNNLKIHLDYRQRLAGNADPGSGAAVTLAGDF